MPNPTQISRTQKSKLFGQVSKAIPTGLHKPSLDSIKEARGINDQVYIASFCEGCGSTRGLEKKLAMRIAKDSGIELPEVIDNEFIITSRCLICNDGFSNARLN